LNVPEIKQAILAELKTAIKEDSDNVVPSKKGPDKFLVTIKDGSHVVVARQTEKQSNKTVFVPVTWLGPHMS
jgi:formylmethanofuran dehydrogenase subunit D